MIVGSSGNLDSRKIIRYDVFMLLQENYEIKLILKKKIISHLIKY